MQALLLHCRLVHFQRNSGAALLEQKWVNLKMEYEMMDFEVIHFTINKKKRYHSSTKLLYITRNRANI
jgi:hypothetical protein